MNDVIPALRFLGSGSVRAVMEKISPTPACVMKILEPLITKWSLCSTAAVLVPPASEPASGSVSPNPPNT